MKTIYLVTGAAGHLGSVLVRKLCAKGEIVRALVLPKDPNAAYLPKQAQLCYGDVTQPETIAPYFRHGTEEKLVVIHAAGIVSISSHYDPKVHQVNVRGTANVVNLCHRYQADKLVYVSSVHAIPELPKGRVMTEIRQFDYHKVVGLYAKTKAAATAIVLRAAKKGLNASVVHPSGIFGPLIPATATLPNWSSTTARAASPPGCRADMILWTSGMWRTVFWPAATGAGGGNATFSPTGTIP